jgi:glycosyltransferase involved in cell wall biosynthesis
MKNNILIVPCYNEEEVLKHTFSRLKELYDKLIKEQVITRESKICFVDDGSRDKTWKIIEKLKKQSAYVQGVKLSRNFGHQAALIAGLESKCGKFDTYISIDADLQDDIAVIEDMIGEAEKGISIVYGVRDDRKSDSFFKRSTAKGFYKFMSFLGADSVYNHADYRLIDNKALKELLRFQERNLFLRGIVPMVGFRNSIVTYARTKREYGESKYPLRKMIAFAWEGITSVSSKPLSMILYIGLIMFGFSVAILIWATVVLLMQKVIPGWFSIIFPTTFFGGVQMISIGVIGEYIGKIYREIKSRPRYIIENDLE